MALWGKNADILLTGTGSIANGESTIVGSNTLFTEEVSIRNVVDLDGERFVVIEVVDNETLEVVPAAELGASDEEILLSEVPKYLSVTDAIEAVLVSTLDAANTDYREDGIKTPGWNLIQEYTDQNANTRRRVETLVAFKN
ncbi:MAG: hypothetical protein WCY93_08560 [Anaerolineaceae bacterium]